mmetsp:Transcript_17698/g.57611  ORF Transcript_17698/g.57611 Transcript_17698/m.57611 type:complete len:358 (+) Transcript_17698:850-1923(+)
MEDDDGEDGGEELPDGGDGGEGERAEALDGVEDEEGAEARADGDEAEWRPRLGVAREEGASAGELRGGDCGDGGKEQRPEGGPEQHGAHGRALREDGALPRGCEGVRKEVERDEEESARRCLVHEADVDHLLVVIHQEERGAEEDEDGARVLERAIAAAVDEGVEEHDWRHLASLREDEDGEGDELERRVLRHRRDRVRDSPHRVVPGGERHRDRVPSVKQLRAGGEEGGEEQGDGAVAERGEGGLLEPLAERRVRREEEPRHQLLLVVAVRDVSRHHAGDAKRHVARLDPERGRRRGRVLLVGRLRQGVLLGARRDFLLRCAAQLHHCIPGSVPRADRPPVRVASGSRLHRKERGR